MGKTRREFLKTAMAGAAVLASAGLNGMAGAEESSKGASNPVIDMHTHLDIPDAMAMLPGKPPVDPIMKLPMTPKVAAYMKEMFPKMVGLRDPERKIRETTAMGVDLAIISISPTAFFYHLEGEAATKVFRFQNDRITAIVKKYPDKFRGMATVPLQNAPAAAAELERAVRELKLTGVEVATSVNGKLLGDPSFKTFFEKAAELDVPVYTHPVTPSGMDRMQNYYFANIAGYPFESTLSIGSLIFSGTFDRLPGLKVIVSHAGGYLPYVIGRWDHAYRTRPECQDIRKPPSEYLKTLYYDTISHGASQLQFLISLVGADRILLGTDHPFDMGDWKPVESIRKVKGLSAMDRDKVLGGNARALFRV